MINYINENIGKEIDFENDKYLIYSYNNIFNKVRLSLASASYPIFRDESVETIYYTLKKQFEEQIEERKNSINNREETQQPSENIGSYSIEKNSIEDIEENNIKENDLGKKLYNKLYDWGYSVLDNKEDYIELNATGFDRLVLECIDENEYSLAHYSTLNGDAMRSPEITFKIIKKSIEPTSYLDDYLGDYQDYEELQEKPSLISDLKDFLNSWLTNIATQFQLAIQELKKQKNEIKQEDLTSDNTLVNEKVYENNISTEKIVYDNKDIPVDKIREMYPVGTMIMLENMQGENLPKGTIGKVKKVDDMGQIQMLWQNGSSLALNVKVDKFKVLNNENTHNIENKENEKSSEYEQDMEGI